MTDDEAKNITDLSNEYKSLRKERNARAIGVRKDLQDAVLSVLVRETVERANRQLVSTDTD